MSASENDVYGLSEVDPLETFDLTLSREARICKYQKQWNRVLAKRKELEEMRLKLPCAKEFFVGRDVFITGASGFLGRVLLERILHYCPDVGNVYILLRPKKGVKPADRVKGLTDVPLFDSLRKDQPYALEKVVALSGDCAELGLGLSRRDRKLIQDKVSVVFHCAASVRFDDPVKKAVLLNLRGTRELIDICRSMKNLKALCHVSTAYTFTNHNPTLEKVYPCPLDWRTVIRAAESCDPQALDNLGHLLLGFQPNTYTWTKAMSENIINEASADLPVVIVRPSIVVASLLSPIPGWVDNFNGCGGFGAGIMKGVLRTIHNDTEVPRDMIPVDVCCDIIMISTTLTAVGLKFSKYEGAPVVHAVSGEMNWETTGNLVYYCELTKKKFPAPGAIRYPYTYATKNTVLYNILFFFYHIVFGAIMDGILRISGNKPMLLYIYRRMTLAVTALKYFDREFHFSLINLWRAASLNHPVDSLATDLDYEKSARNFDKHGLDQIVGISLYALKDKQDPEGAKTHNRRLFWAEVAWYCFLIGLLAWRFVF